MNNTRFIFLTGGVVSSLGKGIASATLASLLLARNYKVLLRKFDPYLNIDPGTMSPYQHGEVFVTQDGTETDLDLGHYERYTGIECNKFDSITTGKIYSTLLQRERRGDYLGNTVQVIPHITDIIKEFMVRGIDNDVDFVLIEIGGTVGDIEGLPFFETIRQMRYELGNARSMVIHLTLLPFISAAGELKTKPTQHSVKELRTVGIQPDLLLCRSEKHINDSIKQKIALFCNIDSSMIVPAYNCQNTIYETPIMYHNACLDRAVLKHFNIAEKSKPNLESWYDIIEKVSSPKTTINIAIVGKYIAMDDTYKSIIEAINHAAIQNETKVNIIWISSRDEISETELQNADGLIVPGGFGYDGIENKINAIKYARENNIPFLGICLGMQLSVIEFARNVIGIKNAHSSEWSDYLSDSDITNIVGLVSEWNRSGTILQGTQSELGGTMRLGGYECALKKDSKIRKIYNQDNIIERHRHRYEINNNYIELLEKHGMLCSGKSIDQKLVEIVEIPEHNWFFGVQFHPEFLSSPLKTHPLFLSFVEKISELKSS